MTLCRNNFKQIYCGINFDICTIYVFDNISYQLRCNKFITCTCIYSNNKEISDMILTFIISAHNSTHLDHISVPEFTETFSEYLPNRCQCEHTVLHFDPNYFLGFP